MADKVKFGIKNVHVFPIVSMTAGVPTYGDVIDVPGAVSFSMSAQGDINKFYADNIVYYQSSANNGYEGDLTLALIPEEFYEKIFGQIPDANGVMTENASIEAKAFAMTFEEDGDHTGTKFVLYNCTATRPTISGQTTEETIEPQTETVTITGVAIHNAALDKDLVKARCPEGNDQYATFFDAVYQPSGVATYVTVTFDTDGGTAIPDQQVRVGATAEKPEDPTKSGFTFDGWYAEDTFTTEFNFNAPVSVDTTVYAKFTSI